MNQPAPWVVFLGLVVLPFLAGFWLPEQDGNLDNGRIAAFALSFASLLLALGLWGRSLRSDVLGVLVDERNRISLSRFQIVLWTLILLPGLSTALLVNLARFLLAPDQLDGLAAEEPLSGGPLDIVIDWTLVQLAAISVGSLVVAPMALRVKAQQPADEAPLGVTVAAGIAARDALEKVSLSDLFFGEENANKNSLDITRLQMLVLTLILWSAYLVLLIGVLKDPAERFIASFPEFDQTTLALLLASHSGYLAGKVAPRLNTPRPSAVAQAQLLRVQRQLDETAACLAVLLSGSRSTTAFDAEARRISALVESMTNEVVDLQIKLAAGENVLDTVTAIRARADVVRENVAALTQRVDPDDVDEADESLVQEVRDLIRAHSDSAQLGTGRWSAGDDLELESVLKSEQPDFTLDDLHPIQYRRLEEARELLETLS